ncbi:NUDIX domain-containing protein [Streptomyces sp. LMG1-1-1.1]|uniref:NUDIX domain-containing protein n=1 Tax=Streptomyces sp. LMG1-1-1.1 TaxID=3135245 RepID=UPI003467BE69
MPPSPAPIRDLVATYLDRNPGERDGLAALVAALDVASDTTSGAVAGAALDAAAGATVDAAGDPSSRATLPGHITCSAVVIDPDGRVLHVRHRGTGLLLAPGGHVEATDETLLAACVRELQEEAGIPAGALALTQGFREAPIDIDFHTIDAAPSRGEPAHQHYDFRFVFQLAVDGAPELTLQAEEVDGAAWLPFDQVSSPTLRAKLVASELDGTIRPVNASALTHDGNGRYLLHLRDAAEHPAPAPAPSLAPGHGPVTRPGVVAPTMAPPGTVPHIVGVHLYLERDGHVLLGRRHPDAAYAGGLLHTLAGHCEAESATACLVREAYEEAGLVIDPADLELVHTVHLVEPGGVPRLQLFFRASHWEGVPAIREPDKCVGWHWWNAKDLPEPVVPYTRAAIEGIRAGRPYTELGWVR